jgi:hypothetical protein
VLTIAQIRSLKPGPDIDILVAEALGETNFLHQDPVWEEQSYEDDSEPWGGFYCPRCGRETHGSDDIPEGPCSPAYSTDLALAWELLKGRDHRMMQAIGFDLFPQAQRPGEAWVSFLGSDTPALLLCQAFLIVTNKSHPEG